MNAHEQRPGQGMYYTAGTVKLVLLSLCSLGFYDLYWFWMNWRLYAARTDKRVRPLWRTVFLPFWIYPMFRDIRNNARDFNIPVELPPLVMTLAYLYFCILGWANGPEALLALGAIVPFAMANRAALQINRATSPVFMENERITRGNWAVIIIGGAALLTIAYDMLY